MTRQVVLYIDAPQHFRIAEALIGALAPAAPVTVLTTLAAPAGWVDTPVRLVRLRAPALARWPRAARALLRGWLLNRQLRAQLDAAATVGVFNDTGVAQRFLIGLANAGGGHSVLVQDGLTETDHRESTPAFRRKRALTVAVLEPLGLGHYGTSRYGCAGASGVLADGPQAAAFFRARAPGAVVTEAGFVRPALDAGSAGSPYVLFWSVDFLGGLHNRGLHDWQLDVIAALGVALAADGAGLSLRVRLHPGDEAHRADYAERLAGRGSVTLSAACEAPFAHGLPLAALSLQSAAVFDSLATRVPSFFLGSAARTVAPAWTPAELMLAPQDCAAVLARLQRDAGAADALWHAQIAALRPRIRIPFDARQIRAAFTGEAA